ncbi:MAG: type II toxin-antitoxin system RelE/ParE family toxin [Candidatus Parabeggiatoa sp. nov. 2]|nr:MAG: plasmid stabilization protein [Beggiatoa sp. 4572_84]RKZ63457.1 MAG: type II toxin-antitoxin system RelE/ParE family toxin [Gammaproteobacteria bacterium]
MNVSFKASFARDLQNIVNANILKRIQTAIEQVEQAQDLRDVDNLKKLKIGNTYYRIRIGSYKIGLLIKDDLVIFVRCLHRKDFSRYFP